MPPLVGTTVAGRYQILSKIADGGMAKVYLALDTRLDRQVALKVIHQSLSTDLEFLEKFSQEAKLAAKLSHPNLVNVFDQGQDGGVTYLAMEYVEGITLREALRRVGKLTADQALDLYEQLLSGLAAAHQAKILHRDLKPENVLLADNGTVKLADFGLARSVSAQTQSGSLVGTVAYLSPELVMGRAVDARSDVYAAGVMLYELVTGKQPYQGEQAVQIALQHANNDVPAPSVSSSDVPTIVDDLVLWSTARDPNQRPENAVELLAAVKRARTALRQDETARLDFTRVLPAISNDATQVMPAISNDATQVISTAGEFSAPLVQNASAGDPGVQDEYFPLSKLNKRALWPQLILASVFIALMGLGLGWAFGSGPFALKPMPAVAGLSVEQANVALQDCRCDIWTEFENSKTVPNGRVIRSNPIAGQPIWVDVTLVVSKGAKLSTVPELTKVNLASATAEILKTGFALGSVSSWFSVEPIGAVFAQSEKAGGKLAEGAKIDLKVSLGPLPMLSNVSKTLATAALEASGLEVSIVTEQFSDTVAAGNVISFVPLTEPIGAGGQVELIVSKGPVPSP